MIARSLFAAVTGAALCALSSPPSAQFVVSTNKATYEAGETLIIGEKLVNSSMLPIPYSTSVGAGVVASIQYQVQWIDVENSVGPSPAFHVERNGQRLKVRTIHFHGVSSGFSGEIGPGRSSALGGTLGFGVPFNLLLAPPAATGARIELTTDTYQVITLAPGERIAIVTPGAYRVTALVDGIQINGYVYSRSTTGYLVAEAFFNVDSRKRLVRSSAAGGAAATR